jgi:putative DNA primase/helicase
MEEKIYTAAAISGGNDTLEEALAVASRGWRVFPLYTPDASGVCNCPSGIACSNPGKHPRTRKGLHDGTTDATAIRAWWAKYPATNYGIVTGKRSGIVVVDIDNRHQGPGGLATLEAEHGVLITALSQQSGDGQHLFFQHPGTRIPNGTALASGVDVRGDGGYVVGPGSRHANGQLYHWSTSAGRMIPLAILPTAWVGLLSKDRASLHGPSARSIFQGQRNDQLFRIARAMRGRGKLEREIRSELTEANLSHCVPPLDETEVAAIAKSATRYEPDRGFDLVTSRGFRSYRPNNRPPDAVGRLVRLSAIKPEKVDWLWRGWLPAGKVTHPGW